jgi:hypothetical protein
VEPPQTIHIDIDALAQEVMAGLQAAQERKRQAELDVARYTAQLELLQRMAQSSAEPRVEPSSAA